MLTNIWRSLLWASALFAIAQGLMAAEGVILIDQKSASAGKVTPQDTPGFPVTISQPGSYRLTGNLEVSDTATTAIEITADNVTLDLNGFTISGPNVCTPNPTHCSLGGGSGVGIMAVAPVGVLSPANVRVMNGVVRGMGSHGIRMMGDGTLVQNVVAASNGGPGIVVGEGSVIDSVAKLNETGTAIVGLIVRGCTAANNSFGIFVRPGGVASGNVAIANTYTGISLNYASASGNTAYNNGGYGIDATCPGVLTNNTSYGNAGGNIRMSGVCTSANNTF